MAAVSCCAKLMFGVLGIFSGLPMKYGLCTVIVVDYLCIVTWYFWLARRTVAGHLGRAKLESGIQRTCAVILLLVTIAIPGAVLHSWRLSVEVSKVTLAHI